MHDFVIGNVDDYTYNLNGVPNSVRVYRKYWGWEFLFNKRFSNRWQLLASYVYSKAYGTLDNAGSDEIGYGALSSDSYLFTPNFFISGFNADGTPILGVQNAVNDPTHMIKIQGTYVLPFDISFNAYFHAITGDAWGARIRGPRIPERVTFQVDPRGTYHYKMDAELDLRLEKTFTLAKRYKLGVILDVFNVFNSDAITSWGTRANYDWNIDGTPAVTDGHEILGTTLPRRARVGLRLTF